MNLRQPKFRTRFKPGQIVLCDEKQYYVANTVCNGNRQFILIYRPVSYSYGKDCFVRQVLAKNLCLVRGVS
ncbi:hypothetical protein [Acinetobacter sp.]|uniref:hypothetical protein n=1 Tax=Acinetobacter sp. TaxID=472 RepID=UPI002FDAB77E